MAGSRRERLRAQRGWMAMIEAMEQRMLLSYSVSVSGPALVNEGAPYTLELGSTATPGTILSWTIDWGDGNVLTYDGNPASVTHAYANGPASFSISAKSTDAQGERTATILAPVRVPGGLDPEFATGGIRAQSTAGSKIDAVQKVLVQPDGRYIVAGYSGASSNTHDFLLAQFNANGTLDTTFGSAGFVITDFGSAGSAYAMSAGLMPDGRIVAVGDYHNNAAIARYLPDGSPDPDFGDGGKRVFTFGTTQSRLRDMALLPDGSFYAAGSRGSAMALYRFTADGNLDTSFGDDGVAVPGLGTTANAMVMLPDGKIFLAGTAYVSNSYYAAVVRLMPNGSVDTSFASNGRALVSLGTSDRGIAMALQSDGKIILSTETNTTVAGKLMLVGFITRLTTNGVRDSTFGQNGARLLYNGSHAEFANALLIGSDDAIYAAGTSYVPYQPGVGRADMALFRFTPSGAFDATFGDNGRVRVDYSPTGTTAHDYGQSLAFADDERIIFAGRTDTGTPSDLALARAFIGSKGVVKVLDVPPVLTLNAPAAVPLDEPVVITFSAQDVPADPVNEWTIDWGDHVETIPGDQTSASRLYSTALNHTIRLRAHMDDGVFEITRAIRINAPAPYIDEAGTLHVTGRDAADHVSLYVEDGMLKVRLDDDVHSFPLAAVARIELRNSGVDDVNTIGAGVVGGEMHLAGGSLALATGMDSDVPLAIHATGLKSLTIPAHVGAAISITGTVNLLILKGTAGDDTFHLTDSGATSAGNTVAWTTLPTFRIEAGDGDDLIEIDAPLSSLSWPVSTVLAGAGHDTIRIHAFTSNANAPLSVQTEGGDDEIEIFGTFRGQMNALPGSGANRLILHATEQDDQILINDANVRVQSGQAQLMWISLGLRTPAEMLDFTIRGLTGGDSLTLNTGTTTVPPGEMLDPAGPAVAINNSAAMVLRSSQRFSQLALSPAGQIDITDQDLLIAANDDNRDELLAWARARVASGRIFSSAASPIHGLIVTTDASGDVLVRRVVHGDVNVDGVLDGDDYFEIDRAYLFGLEARPEADINHDQRIDLLDYFLIDRAFLILRAQAAAPAADGPAALRVERVWDALDNAAE